MSSNGKVWSIPAGTPFLKTLARAVLDGGFPSPELPPPGPADLPRYTILVPTRRAARELAVAFLNASDGNALLLPAIRPLGDVDEEELLLTPESSAGSEELDATPAVTPLRRQLLLANLLVQWARSNADAQFSRALLAHPFQVIDVAEGLGRMVDQLETEEIGLDRLTHVVSENFSAYWLDVLAVLDVVRERLPEELSRIGMIGPVERRNRLLNAEATRLAEQAPDAPHIAAGSTGSIPATANLLKAIAGLPNGAVVLPGLDTRLDEDSWKRLDPQHPQFGIRELLGRLEVRREDVRELGDVTEASRARGELLSEVTRPSETTDLWQSRLPDLQSRLARALDGLILVRAPGRREEALCIALAMREAVETPGRTAALVTSDRGLGRQVSAQLKRWNLEVDDSAGVPLSGTVPGVFIDLVLNVLENDFSPSDLVALCAHPLARFGRPGGEAARAARKLELAVLRGVAPADLDDWPAAVDRRREEVARKPRWFPHLSGWSDGDWEEAVFASRMIPPAFEDLVGVARSRQPVDLKEAVEAAVRTAEKIADDENDKSSGLWSGEAGEHLALFLSNLLEAAEDAPPLEPFGLRGVVMGLMAQSVVRPRYGTHPRLRILGLMEARMMDHDVVVLGGLNEKSWPAQTETDPWLNRPMRADLGLASPELRMGQSAHDFVQGACSPGAVYLCCSDKREGAPAVRSRWLLRLDAILEGLQAPDVERAGKKLLASALDIDRAKNVEPVGRPAPAPALELRPMRLGVTEIETWLRDPYAIYGRHVLKLSPLEALALQPGPRERGMLFHRIFELFSSKWKRALPADVAGELERIAESRFDEWRMYPEVSAFWWPRFLRIAGAAAEIEGRLRRNADAVHVEATGSLDIPVPVDGAGPFTLYGRADRIDRLEDGTARIVDYKTGTLPGVNEVFSGKAPQLLLEAVMLSRGAFEDIPAAKTTELMYVQLSGGDPAMDVRKLDPARSRSGRDGDVANVSDSVFSRLERLVARHCSDPAYAYLPRRLPKYQDRELPYDHLSRHREWSDFSGASDEGP